jgi:hypothetical protein
MITPGITISATRGISRHARHQRTAAGVALSSAGDLSFSMLVGAAAARAAMAT